tara:strand:+ start:841 stop:1557 length:717 start_codon:yes stop_codon:yes gene_type:complete
MEQQDVAPLERDRLAGVDQVLVGGEILAEELLLVEPFGVERHGVAAGDQVQRPVFGRFRSQGQPGADQFGSGERPVPEVLVPSGAARVLRLFGHHAVVVGQWQNQVGAQEAGETGDQVIISGPIGKQGMPVDRLLQSPGRFATGVGSVGRGSGITEVGLVFDRAAEFSDFPVDHVLQPGTGLLGRQPTNDDESVATETLSFLGRQLAGVGVHVFLPEALSGGAQRPRHRVLAVSTMRI